MPAEGSTEVTFVNEHQGNSSSGFGHRCYQVPCTSRQHKEWSDLVNEPLRLAQKERRNLSDAVAGDAARNKPLSYGFVRPTAQLGSAQHDARNHPTWRVKRCSSLRELVKFLSFFLLCPRGVHNLYINLPRPPNGTARERKLEKQSKIDPRR